MKFILPINAVTNAQKCVAKYEVRYYLEGFHVTKKAVEATNGHYAYRAKLKEFALPEYLANHAEGCELPESMIIKMKQPIKKPAKSSGCEFVFFDVQDSKVIATTIDQFGGEAGCFLGSVIDGKFPDVEGLVIQTGEPENHSQVGYNADYLKKLSEVCDTEFKSVKLQSYGEDKASVFEIINPINMFYDAIFVLMPIRLWMEKK